LSSKGQYAEAELLYNRVLTMRENQFGPKHPYLVATLENLGSMCVEQSKHAQAEQYFRRGLTITEKTLGKCHSHLPDRLDRLALTCLHQDKFDQAEKLLKRALAIRAKTGQSDTAQSLETLAELYRKTGRTSKAKAMAKRAAALANKEHP
jgi:tetratricopeptide (TPR) repeat protein